MPAKHDITVHEGRQPASRRLEEVAGLGFKKPGTHPTLLCLLTLTDSGGGGGWGWEEALNILCVGWVLSFYFRYLEPRELMYFFVFCEKTVPSVRGKIYKTENSV